MTIPMDVMVVGEPGLMGGDFGEEDERLITRLENNQIDPPAPNHNLHQYHHSPHIQQQQHHRSSPINSVNQDMHPARPHSLQSQLSQPNISSNVMPLPPRPQSTSSHLLNSNVNEPLQTLQSPDDKIILGLVTDVNDMTPEGVNNSTNGNLFNSTTSTSNIASSSDSIDFTEQSSSTAVTVNSNVISVAPSVVNQPSTSSSSIASSSVTSPNNNSPPNITCNNNANGTSKSDVQQSLSIPLSNY